MKTTPKLPDLKKLQHAITLADSGNYARACEQLCITQSALTRSIQALELDLGVRLFDRSTRRMELTPEGESIVAWAKELIANALTLSTEIDRLTHGDVGRVAFGIGPAMPSLFLSQLLHEIHTRHPALSIDITIEDPTKLLEHLREDRIEFFLSETAHVHFKPAHNFIVQDLALLEGGFFVRRGHPLTKANVVDANMLADYTLATTQFQQSHQNSEQPLKQFFPHHIMCNDLHSLQQLLMNSDVVLVGLKSLVASELAQGSVCKLTLASVAPFRPCTIGIVKRKNRTFSRPATEINQWLTHYFSRLP